MQLITWIVRIFIQSSQPFVLLGWAIALAAMAMIPPLFLGPEATLASIPLAFGAFLVAAHALS